MSDKVHSCNANSHSFLSLFNDVFFLPEILVLTKTLFKADSMKNMNMYKAYHKVGYVQRSIGVSVYVRDHLNSELVEHLCIFNETVELCTVPVNLSGRDT